MLGRGPGRGEIGSRLVRRAGFGDGDGLGLKLLGQVQGQRGGLGQHRRIPGKLFRRREGGWWLGDGGCVCHGLMRT